MAKSRQFEILYGTICVGGKPVLDPVPIEDPYEGPYEVTPTQETQILPTRLKGMLNNVKINPIPSNYGLVSWNGAFLKVQ